MNNVGTDHEGPEFFSDIPADVSKPYLAGFTTGPTYIENLYSLHLGMPLNADTI